MLNSYYPSTPRTLYARRLIRTWDSKTLTWSSTSTTEDGPLTTEETGAANISSVGTLQSNWYILSVKTMTKNILNGAATNYGWRIKDKTTEANNELSSFHSSDCGNSNAPQLIINYTVPTPAPKKNAVLVGEQAANHDHSTWRTKVKSNLSSCDFTSIGSHYGSFTIASIQTYLDLDTNTTFISRSHGTIDKSAVGYQIGTKIQLNEKEKIYFSSYSDMDNLNLSNMKLAMFIGCQTGVGLQSGKNLPAKAVEKGARCAIGFADNIGCETANSWVEDFSELMKEGRSVGEACETLKSRAKYKNTSMTKYVLCGNSQTKLK